MITFEKYLTLPGVNISSLLLMAKSPRHYQWVVGGGERPDSAALRAGRLCHMAVLEPDRFAEEVAVWTGGIRRGKEYDRWCAETEGKTQVNEAEHELAMAVATAVRQHPVAGMYLSSDDAVTEVTLQWKHRIGIDLKARLDWLDLGQDLVIDLKTTRDASENEFGRAAARLDYAARAAFYADAYLEKFGNVPRFVLIAVEKVPPFAVAVYRVGEDLLEAGRRQYEKLLGQLKLCLDTDRWPGLNGDGEADLIMPSWFAQADDGLDLIVDGEAHRVG